VLRSRTSAALAAACVLSVTALTACSSSHGSTSQGVTALSADPPTAAAGGAVASGAPSASVAPSLTPTAGAPTVPAVAGYSLGAGSATVVRSFQTVVTRYNRIYSGLTVRTFTKGTGVSGTVVLLGLRSNLVGEPSVERGLLPALVKGMGGEGVKTSSTRVGSQDVVVGITKTTNIVGWYRAGTVVLLFGNGLDTAPTLAFAKGYLAAR